MDAYLKVLIKHVKDAGFYVIPKDRVGRYQINASVSHMELAHLGEYAKRYHEHRVGSMGHSLGMEIIQSPHVAWAEREDRELERTIYAAEVRLIQPKTLET